MASVVYSCTECKPVDTSIIEAYLALVRTMERAKDGEEYRNSAEFERETAESGRAENERVRQGNEEDRNRQEELRVLSERDRVSAEGERERVSGIDHAQYTADHGVFVEDHQIATDDHLRSASDHTRAEIDHNRAEGDHSLIRSSVLFTPQILTDEQEEQARENIGAGTYTKPVAGIPASDLANGVIPDVSQFITKSVNDLTNYYLKSETYTQAEVQALIGAISQFHYEIAASTSAVSSPASNVLYLIGPTGSGADKYEEYVYPNSTQGWVKIGDTSIDLSGYVTTQALNNALAGLNDVKFTAQSLTDAQKTQARTNIGATAPEVFVAIYGTTTFAEITNALAEGKVVVVRRVLNSGTDNENIVLYGSPDNVLNYAYIFSRLFFDTTGFGSATEQVGVDISDEWSEAGQKSIEDASNKVSSWSSVPNDYQYPTEKLVKDSLDGKQPLIGAQHKLDYSLIANTPTIPTEVFVVTYGTTTQSEVLTAVAAGQLPVCKYGDNLYVYAGESSADYSQFTSVLYDTAYRIYVKNSTWGGGSYEIYSKPSGGIPASDIASGVIPAAPVNADWNASSGLAQILNKPSIPAAQVNADWNATSGVAEILNKPSIPTVESMTNSEIDSAVNTAWV